MKKRTIAIIIIITSLSLIGIIIIQIFWVKNALRLQEEQFDNAVQVTLKSVVNRMFAARGDSLEPGICGEHCDHRTFQILSAINPDRLDSLLHEEFTGMEITRQYAWGVYNPKSRQIFSGHPDNFQDKLIATNHAVSLSCLYYDENLMLGVFFPGERQALYYRIFPYLILAFFLLAIIIFAFSYIIFSFLKQKKLSEMKNDFVNNMTHEFKTPISTISLASEMLLSPGIHDSPARTRRYARIILDENLRLKQQVEQVLHAALMDKGQYKLHISQFDAHDAIKSCVKSFELTVRDKGGFITSKLQASSSRVHADYHQFINIVNNLLDNAAKYSKGYPEIMIITRNENDDRWFILEVHDKGIGISADNMKHIFRKLYRVPTGNVHDVKGFGLGLYYVKTIAEAHGGFIKVKSELREGSTFELHLPLNPNDDLTTAYHEPKT